MYAKSIPEISPIEIFRNFFLSSINISEVPKLLSINKIQGEMPIKSPERNTISKLAVI